jgi:hypothetical protein
MRSRFRYQN